MDVSAKERDSELVHKVMQEMPNASLRVWAARLGWVHQNGRPQQWRVEIALNELAISGRVRSEGGKWKLINVD